MASQLRPVAYDGLHGLSWIATEELEFLDRHLPDFGLFVEVGTASGVTAALIADRKPDLTIICVDTFADHDAAHVVGGERCRIDNWRLNRRPNMHLWVGTLRNLYMLSHIRDADAILVDGDHDLEGVSGDLRIAEAMLGEGGVLMVHDYGEPRHPDVSVAVDGFVAESGFRIASRCLTLVQLTLDSGSRVGS